VGHFVLELKSEGIRAFQVENWLEMPMDKQLLATPILRLLHGFNNPRSPYDVDRLMKLMGFSKKHKAIEAQGVCDIRQVSAALDEALDRRIINWYSWRNLMISFGIINLSPTIRDPQHISSNLMLFGVFPEPLENIMAAQDISQPKMRRIFQQCALPPLSPEDFGDPDLEMFEEFPWITNGATLFNGFMASYFDKTLNARELFPLWKSVSSVAFGLSTNQRFTNVDHLLAARCSEVEFMSQQHLLTRLD